MKNKIEKANLAAMIIGGISVLFGLYGLFQGSDLGDTSFSLFIGATLLGTAYFNHVAQHKNKNTQN